MVAEQLMPLRRARSERGTRYQLALLLGTDDLKAMLATAFDAADQIVAFTALVQEELSKRGERPSNPYDVA